LGRKWPLPNQSTIPAFAGGTEETHRKKPVRKAGVKAEIQTEHLLNVGLEHYL
jgi:hypothetical protein